MVSTGAFGKKQRILGFEKTGEFIEIDFKMEAPLLNSSFVRNCFLDKVRDGCFAIYRL